MKVCTYILSIWDSLYPAPAGPREEVRIFKQLLHSGREHLTLSYQSQTLSQLGPMKRQTLLLRGGGGVSTTLV